MLDVVTVLRNGGGYDSEWVRKLRDAAKRHVSVPHRFRCLSDVEVPCDRIPLKHDWPGWWAKIELFNSIENPTLYLDLDTVLTGEVKTPREAPDFAMLQSFWTPDMVGSGVMWFSGDNVPKGVYTKFARQADAYIAHHDRNANGPYVGDQAFIWDAMGHEVPRVNEFFPGIYSYKLHCKRYLPPDASIVCFHGQPKLPDVEAPWIKENWS